MKKYILTFLSVFLLSFPAISKEKAVNIYAVPRDMPAREIINEQGQKVKLSTFKGDFVLLMLWSRNCVPCVKELDNINGFVNKTQNDGIKVIMLSSSTEWKTAAEQRNFVNKFHAPDLDLYTDTDGKLAEDLGVFTSPHTVLINTSGQEIGRIRGSAEWDDDKVVEYIRKLKEQHG